MLLTPVSNINWSDNTILRVGILPIFNKKWLGFGITKFASNITVIGGYYEKNDFDLLDTAIREFKEEVGNNILISLDILLTCSCIKTEYSICIFYPVPFISFSFRKTEEIRDLIWITFDQFKIMYENKEKRPYGNKGFIFFNFTKNILENGDKIIEVFEKEDPFFENKKVKFERKKLNIEEKGLAIFYDFTKFQSYINTICKNNWRYVIVMFLEDKICLINRNNEKCIFSLELTSKIINFLDNFCYRILFFNKPKNITLNWVKNLNRIDLIERRSTYSKELLKDFLARIDRKNILEKMDEISDYELKIYENIKNTSPFKNRNRIRLLEDLSKLNFFFLSSEEGEKEIEKLNEDKRNSFRILSGLKLFSPKKEEVGEEGLRILSKLGLI